MKIEKCETCIHFGTMPVTGDPRPYPCCNVNHKKTTWDVNKNECKYETNDVLQELYYKDLVEIDE